MRFELSLLRFKASETLLGIETVLVWLVFRGLGRRFKASETLLGIETSSGKLCKF